MWRKITVVCGSLLYQIVLIKSTCLRQLSFPNFKSMSGAKMSLTPVAKVRSIGKTEQSHLTIYMSLLAGQINLDGWGRSHWEKAERKKSVVCMCVQGGAGHPIVIAHVHQAQQEQAQPGISYVIEKISSHLYMNHQDLKASSFSKLSSHQVFFGDLGMLPRPHAATSWSLRKKRSGETQMLAEQPKNLLILSQPMQKQGAMLYFGSTAVVPQWSLLTSSWDLAISKGLQSYCFPVGRHSC